MASPRKSTSLLAWLPAQGTPGQRHANRALVRAFAAYATRPEARTGRVREALAAIAAEAEALFAERIGDAEAEAPAEAPAPERKASARKGARKGKRASARKAEADSLAYRCGPCNAEIAAGMREKHEATARHKRAYAAR